MMIIISIRNLKHSITQKGINTLSQQPKEESELLLMHQPHILQFLQMLRCNVTQIIPSKRLSSLDLVLIALLDLHVILL